MKALSKTFLLALSINLLLFSCKKTSSDSSPTPSAQGISSWTAINFPNQDSLSDVFATSVNTIYACGAYGNFYKSANAGQDWELIEASYGSWMSGICFTDVNTGYLSGNNSIPAATWKTIDAGATWQKHNLPSIGDKYTSYAVHFPTASIGYEVGEGGETYKTTDAGEHWTLNATGSSQPFYSVFFTSSTTGYIGGGNNTLMKTTDGGTTWNALTTNLSANADSYIQAIYFLDANTGYITGGANPYFRNSNSSAPSFILKTTDGGATWTSLSNPVTGDDLFDIYFTDASIGYCIGGNAANYTSTILKTTDAGVTWTVQPSSGHSLSKMCYVDGVMYCVGGIGTVLKGN